jgi:hypothetical protein
MKKCVLCEKSSGEIPVISFEYQGSEYGVCTAHLPALLHKPELFEGKLADAGKAWTDQDHHHDH